MMLEIEGLFLLLPEMSIPELTDDIFFQTSNWRKAKNKHHHSKVLLLAFHKLWGLCPKNLKFATGMVEPWEDGVNYAQPGTIGRVLSTETLKPCRLYLDDYPNQS